MNRRFLISLACTLALLLFSGCNAEESETASAAPEAAADVMAEFPLGDAESWREPQFITASLRSIDQLFPTRTISAAPTPSSLTRSETALEVSYEFGGATHDLDDFAERTRTTGLLILHDGEILHESYHRGSDENSRFLSMSMAKSFTATLLGIARGDGLIKSFDDPVTDYIPELKGTGYDGVSIRHILQMSSGIDFVEEYADPESDIAQLGGACFGGGERLRDVAVTYGRKTEPGSVFYYASVDTAILGWLLSNVTGQSLSEYMQERVWHPLGAEASAYWAIDQDSDDGVECSLGGFNATLRDYARFGLLNAYDGLWQGQRVLPEGWVAEATIPDSPQVQPGKLYPGYPLGYQYQWWTFPDDDHSFTAEGIHGQLLMVNPVLDLVLVKTSDWETAWEDDKEAETWALWQAVQDRVRQQAADKKAAY
jgi:CubicO group peptidase (beta-lactamase class C family)